LELLNPLNDPSYAVKTVAFTGTAGSTGTWPPGPDGVLVWADAACYVAIGTGVTATTTNGTAIPANTPIPFLLPANVTDAWRVSAIQISTGGNLYAKPINKE
jgi:hypothetical protein